MTAYRVSVNNPSTGQHFGFVIYAPTPDEALDRAIQNAEDRTPIGELPATQEDWDYECIEV